MRYSIVWHCRISFWDCISRIEMHYHKWIWLGIGVDTEALRVVATEAGGKLLHSPTTGLGYSRLSSFPWLKCSFYSTRVLKPLSYIWRVHCSDLSTVGITQELLFPLHFLLSSSYCRWLSTVRRIQRTKNRQMRIVVKKCGVHKKVVSGINVKFLIILVFVVTVLNIHVMRFAIAHCFVCYMCKDNAKWSENGRIEAQTKRLSHLDCLPFNGSTGAMTQLLVQVQ